MSRFVAPLLAILLGGCSVVPRQEDVTGEATTRVVAKIRCEARDALDAITVDLLRDPRRDATAATRELADRIESRDLRAVDLQQPRYFGLLSPQQREIFLAYTLSAVTFDFRFNIEENNRNGGTAGLSDPFTRGALAVGLSAAANFQRQTERRFQITNTFYSLHALDPVTCDRIAARAENVIYPLTGIIGVEKVFRDFVDVDLQRTSYGPESKYYDRLTFSTTYTAGATPALTLTPTPAGGLTGLSAALSASRADVHEVTLNLARGKRVTPAALEGARREAAAESLRNANFTRIEDLFILRRDQLDRFLR